MGSRSVWVHVTRVHSENRMDYVIYVVEGLGMGGVECWSVCVWGGGDMGDMGGRRRCTNDGKTANAVCHGTGCGGCAKLA